MGILKSKKLSLWRLATTAGALCLILVVAKPAYAEDTAGSPQADNTTPPKSFEYVVRRSNNLTLLVRRSLQLYDESDKQLALSEPQVVYAETNIVQQLGARGLDIGQQVDVPLELVAQFAKSSQDLSEARLTAWTRWSRRADFTLTNIEPKNLDVVSKADLTKPPADDDKPADQSQAPQAETQAGGQSSDGVDWWWIALLAVVVWGLWTIFSRQDAQKK